MKNCDIDKWFPATETLNVGDVIKNPISVAG